MLRISPCQYDLAIPDHVEHYTNNCGVVVRISPDTQDRPAHTFSVFIRHANQVDGYDYIHPGLTKDHARKLAMSVLQGIEVQKDSHFAMFINQANRDCEVVKLTPTRARIWYELPRTGETYAWRYCVNINGHRYIQSGNHSRLPWPIKSTETEK